MRTAHRVWSGVFAATFVLVAGVQCSARQDVADTAVASAPRAASSPTGTVASVQGWADVTLTDGRRIHIPMLNGIVNASDDCDRQASMALATGLLAGKTVQLSAPRDRDADGVAPVGWVQADVAVGGGDYAEAFKAQQAQVWYRRCAPAEWSQTPTPTEPAPSSSSGTDVNVDVDHDSDHRGPVERRVCRKTWLC